MKQYLEEFKPGEYFIEEQSGGSYSGSSIEKIVKRAAEKADIKRKVTPHMLRHSFATHHMEKGMELSSARKKTRIALFINTLRLKTSLNIVWYLDGRNSYFAYF